MVLQRDRALPVWGWAATNEQVVVTLADQKVETTANSSGKWEVTLEARSAGGPHELTVAGKNTIVLKDVYLGEVWVCSGQSNMNWRVKGADDAEKEIAAANYPGIRHFNVTLALSGTPQDDVTGSWAVCNPETVADFTAVGYYFGRDLHERLQVPVGLVHSSWGGTRIEAWTPPVGLAQVASLRADLQWVEDRNAEYLVAQKTYVDEIAKWIPEARWKLALGKSVPALPAPAAHPINHPQHLTAIYNSMIHGLLPFAIRGTIWYQGESNVFGKDRAHYCDRMQGLIQGWRTLWGQGDFPFYYVHLAPFKYNLPPDELPRLWEAQVRALNIPNTGMAVTTDIGNTTDIHPTNKQDVGKRLALWALANTYGQTDVVFSGPLYRSHEIDGNKVRLRFHHATRKLSSRDGKPLTWFAVAGQNRKFVEATAEIDVDTVIVHSDQVPKPMAVRFGWDELAEPNLVNAAKLPAAPFRTDSW
jgi:sialate O-acetylesterase